MYFSSVCHRYVSERTIFRFSVNADLILTHGISIPYSDITNQLVTVYNSPGNVTIPNDPDGFATVTPQLMAQVAMKESTYKQFAFRELYNFSALWPLESPPSSHSHSGSHVGLTQVPVTMADAWDWLQNTEDGVILPSQNSIEQKLRISYSKVKLLQAVYGYPSTMPDLSPCQLEEMAVELYGPYSGGIEVGKQYYTGQRNSSTGYWQWVINITGNNCGVCYVAHVRNEIPLSDDYPASMCPGSPPDAPNIPADPPTTLNCTGCPAS
jgi:hypothetical protein